MNVLRVICPVDVRDPASSYFRNDPFEVELLDPCRILYVPQFGDSPVDPEVRASVAMTAEIFADLGHSLDEGEAPFAIEPLAQAWGVIGQVGLAWLLDSKPGWEGKITPALEEMAAQGKARTGPEYFAALNVFKELEQSLSFFFQDYEAILTPTAAALPWPVTDPYPRQIDGHEAGPRTHAVFTGFANISGCPGISFPPTPPRTVCRSVLNSWRREAGMVFCVVWPPNLSRRTLGPNWRRCLDPPVNPSPTQEIESSHLLDNP